MFSTAGINNLTISATVVVLFACFHDCCSLFWQLFESSLPKVLRPGHDLSPQCELHVLEVLEVSFAAEGFQAEKCIEIAWSDVRGIGWMR